MMPASVFAVFTSLCNPLKLERWKLGRAGNAAHWLGRGNNARRPGISYNSTFTLQIPLSSWAIWKQKTASTPQIFLAFSNQINLRSNGQHAIHKILIQSLTVQTLYNTYNKFDIYCWQLIIRKDAHCNGIRIYSQTTLNS